MENFKLLTLLISLFLITGHTRAATLTVGNGENHLTIQAAIDASSSGDLILVKDGTYDGFYVSISNLTIMAEHRHGVTITGPGSLISGAENTTLIGLVVDGGGYVSGQNAQYQGMVNAVNGWTIEDCIIKGANGGREGLRTATGVHSANDVRVERTIFQDNGGNAMWGIADSQLDRHNNLVIRDVIMRRNNQSLINPGWYNSGTKILWTKDCMVDGLISYDNYGSGFWFDFGSENYTVQNSTIFGNHGSSSSWANSAIFIEANPGPGYILNNTFYGNNMQGLLIAESQNLTITGNTFAGNGEAWTFRSCCASDGREPPENVLIENNYIYQDDQPTHSGATILNNTILTEFMGPMVSVDNNGSAAAQITQTPESNSIDMAIGTSEVGVSATIPVYGRKAIEEHGSYWKTVVYDLSARYIDLTILDQATKNLIETSVPQYASTEAKYLTITIDKKEEYDIDGSIGSAGPIPLQILVQPQDLTIEEGSNASFSVSAIGTGDLSYQWFQDGVEIEGETGSTLLIEQSTLTANGSIFQVRIQDDNDEQMSLSATLSVVDYLGFKIKGTPTPISIDGLEDLSWENATTPVSLELGNSSNNSDDLSAEFTLLWDLDYLYFKIEVTDEDLIGDSQEPWNDDGVELYLDLGNEKLETFDANDFQFRYAPISEVFSEKNANETGVTRAYGITPFGYLVEMAIPWSTLGEFPGEGAVIGIDASTTDDDDGGDRENQIYAFGDNNNWSDPSDWGEGRIEPMLITKIVTDRESKLTISPNPCQGISKLSMFCERIEIRDHSGRLLDMQQGSTVDLNRQTDGVYFVTLKTSNDESFIRRIIKLQ